MNRAQAVFAATVLGGMAAWQGPANGRLGDSIGAMPAALVSFGTGLICLLLPLLVSEGLPAIRQLPSAMRRIDPRLLSGGLIGPIYVTVAVLTVGDLGAGGLAGAAVAGTLVGAVAIDWAALLGVRRHRPTPLTWLGVAVLLIATFALTQGAARPGALWEGGVVFLAGILVAFQPPVNSRLAARIGSWEASVAQTLVAIGFLCLLSIGVVLFGSLGGGGGTVPWWAYIGGPLGALYVIATLKAVPAIGASGVGAGSIVGGLVFGVAADALGMFGLPTEPVGLSRAIAVVGLIIGMALVLRRSADKPSP